MTKLLLIVSGSALLWLPYYVWGIGAGNRWLAQGRILPATLAVSLTVLVGFFGLHLLQRILAPGTSPSNANFRLLLILSTQLTAVALIAVDSKFDGKAILAGLLVVAGAAVASYAIE